MNIISAPLLRGKRTKKDDNDLESRLNCFGEFETSDPICLKRCALSINCAIAKDRFLSFPFLEENFSPASPFNDRDFE